VIRQLKILTIIALLGLALILPASSSATPDSPLLFQMRRLQEKLFLKLKSSPEEKYNFQYNLLKARFEEVIKLTENKRYGIILPSTQRYFTTAGELTDLVVQNNMKSQAADLIKTLGLHLNKLTQLIEDYRKDLNTEWKFLEDDRNYILIYQDKLSQLYD